MRSTYCMACLTEYPARPQDGPFRMLSCVRCLGNKEALECSDCHYKFRGIPGKSVCKRCFENKLAEKGIFPGTGWKDPV